ncbi:MAG: alanine racemase [Actinomycetota bacterium]
MINTKKIKQNAEHAVSVCATRNIQVIGVTKACLGDPVIAGAMLDGGVAGIGDSRPANLVNLRGAGITEQLMMLRLPMLSEIPQIVDLSDISLNSDLTVIEALGRAAARVGKKHKVIIMVDMGDGREGVRREDAVETAMRAAQLQGVEVVGLGVNVACLAGQKPTPDQMKDLVALANDAREKAGIELPVVSGGNSSAWELIESGEMPPGINQVRLGEAILLGKETARGRLIQDMHHDAFVIKAEIIESIPERGHHHIAALGRQDIEGTQLFPLDDTWRIVKASSDHFVLKKSGPPARTGAVISFIPGYESLLKAMTSPFVTKQYV